MRDLIAEIKTDTISRVNQLAASTPEGETACVIKADTERRLRRLIVTLSLFETQLAQEVTS